MSKKKTSPMKSIVPTIEGKCPSCDKEFEFTMKPIKGVKAIGSQNVNPDTDFVYNYSRIFYLINNSSILPIETCNDCIGAFDDLAAKKVFERNRAANKKMLNASRISEALKADALIMEDHCQFVVWHRTEQESQHAQVIAFGKEEKKSE